MGKLARVPQRHRQVAWTDEDDIDAWRGRDRVKMRQGSLVLDLRYDHCLLCRLLQVGAERQERVIAGAGTSRQPPATKWGIVGGLHKPCGFRRGTDMWHHNPCCAGVERSQDVYRRVR